MGEWLKPAVLKTVSGVTRSGVRIPLPPPALSQSLSPPRARIRPFRYLLPATEQKLSQVPERRVLPI